MQSRLEEYLEEVSRPVPAAERAEWRLEAQQHLAAIVAAYEELGHSPEEATELALSKFGEAKSLGRRMGAEAARGGPMPVSMKVATALFALQGLMCWCISIPRWVFGQGQNEGLLVWGAPALFIALGLLLRRPFWRKAALASLCTTLALSIPFTLTVRNWAIERTLLLACWRVLTYCVLPAWQLWVLTRPEVKAMFEEEPPRAVVA